MKIAIVLLVVLIPLEAMATQYECRGKRHKLIIDALSKAEAQHTFSQQFPSETFLECSSKKINPDIFVRNGFFENNTHLRPYMPPDLKGDWEAEKSGKTYNIKERYRCNSSGGFSSDSDGEVASCTEFTSALAGGSFRIRYALRQRLGGIIGADGAIQVWRNEGGAWKPWVEFQNVAGYPLKAISSGAQQYAAAHGATPPVATATSDGSSPPPSNEKPADPGQAAQTAVKDATKALKGLFGR